VEKEEWRPIEGYEGLYEVSNLGQVRSLDRFMNGPNGEQRPLKGKLKKPTKNFKGYYIVNLYREGKPATHSVHRLVAIAFLGQPPEGHFVCHGPKGQQCNEVTNLSWGTPQKNQKDRFRDGTDSRGEKCNLAKLNETQVREIRRLLESTSMTQKEIAEMFGVSRGNIHNINARKTWGHLESNKEFNCIS